MSKLSLINSILHSDFLCDRITELQEKDAGMSVSINATGCQYLLYKYDKELKREYKGGLFPFFAKEAGVCSVCDYILFAERSGKLYALIIELKKGKKPTLPQLNAAKCFVDFIISTLNRVKGISLNPEIRLISIHEYNVHKKSIKDRGVQYDKDGHYQFKQSKFEIKKFLI